MQHSLLFDCEGQESQETKNSTSCGVLKDICWYESNEQARTISTALLISLIWPKQIQISAERKADAWERGTQNSVFSWVKKILGHSEGNNIEY